MPSRSWMLRSEYRPERGLRQVESMYRAGVGYRALPQSQTFLSSLGTLWSG